MPSLGSVWTDVRLNYGPAAAGATKVKSIMSSLDADMEAKAAKISNRTSSIGSAFKKVAEVGVVAVAALGVASFKMASDFDSNMHKAWSVTDDSRKSMGAWGDEVLKMSTRFPKSAKDMADALYWIKSDMPDASDADQFKTLEIATKGAVGGVAELSDATEALITVQNAYNDMDPAKYMDTMNWAVQRGSITLQDFVSNMGKATGTAAMADVPFIELSAAVATLTRKGVPADTAFMALNQTMMNFLKPTDEAAETAAAFGVDLSLTTLRSKGLAGALLEIGEKVPDEELAELFPNVRALKAVFPLAGTASAEFARDLALAGEASGTTEEMFDKNMDAIENKVKTALNKLKKPMIEFGLKMFPYVEKGIEAVGNILEGKNSVFNAFAGTLKEVVTVGVKVVKALWDMKTPLVVLGGLFAAVKLSGVVRDWKAFSVSAGLLNPVLAGTKLSISELAKMVSLNLRSGLVTGVASLGGFATSLASIALPVGIVAAAIGTFLYASKKSTDEMTANWKSVKEADKAFGELGLKLRPMIERYEQLRNNTERTNEEQAEFVSLGNQIADMSPNLIASIDGQGNAFLKNDQHLNNYVNDLLRYSNIKPTTKGKMGEFEATAQGYENLTKGLQEVQNAELQLQVIARGMRPDLINEAKGVNELSGYLQLLSTDFEDGKKKLIDFMEATQNLNVGQPASMDKESGLFGLADTVDEASMKNLKNAIDDIGRAYEDLGVSSGPELRQKIAELSTTMAQQLPILQAEARQAGETGQALSTDILLALRSGLPQFRDAGITSLDNYIQGLLSSQGKLTSATANTSSALAAAIAAGDWASAWNHAGQEGIQGLVTGIQTSLMMEALPEINIGAGQIPAVFIEALKSGVPELQANAVEFLRPFIDEIARFATQDAPEKAGEVSQSIVDQLKSGDYAGTGTIAGDQFLSMMAQQVGQDTDVQTALAMNIDAMNAADPGLGKGKQLADAMAKGVTDQQDKVRSAMRNAVDIDLGSKTIRVDVKPGNIETVTVPISFKSSPALPLEPWLAHVKKRMNTELGSGISGKVNMAVSGGAAAASGSLAADLAELQKKWAAVTGIFGAFNADMLLGPIREVEEALVHVGIDVQGKSVDEAYAQLKVWNDMRGSLDALNGRLKQYGDAIEKSEAKIARLQHAQDQIQSGTNGWVDSIGKRHKSLDALRDRLGKVQESLSRLSQMKLKGEGAADDRSFAQQQDINKYQLQILETQAKIRAGTATTADIEAMVAAERQKEMLEQQKEINDLQTQITYEPQRREIEKMLDPLKGQERTQKEILKLIKERQAEEAAINKEIALGEAAAKRIEKQIKNERENVYQLRLQYDSVTKAVNELSQAIDEMARNAVQRWNEIKRAAEEAARAAGGAAGGGAVPTYHAGTWSVSRTGLANVLAGELILPPSLARIWRPIMQSNLRPLNVSTPAVTSNTNLTVPIYLDGKQIARHTTKIQGRRTHDLARGGGRL